MAPCNWDLEPDCASWAALSDPEKERAIRLATNFLWAATGRRFGACPLTIRPGQSRLDGAPVLYQAYPAAVGQDAGLWGPFLFGGRWFNRGCSTACCGASACAIVLRGPVAAVDEVLVDSDVVPASAYRVDVTDGTYLLVRIDGECWPACQNFRLDTTEPGTFEVTYDIGTAPPLALLDAAAMLACEYGKAITGGACALPAKMTRLSRQGVDIEVEPPAPDDGKTGVAIVDAVIATFNPGKRQRPPLLLSPDLPEACDRRTVIQAGS
jgi:hypothetical protein